MNWDADFAGLPPIELPDGRKLETFAECAAYILNFRGLGFGRAGHI